MIERMENMLRPGLPPSQPARAKPARKLTKFKVGRGESWRGSFAGCTLHVDWEDEVYYLELEPFHSRKAKAACLFTIEALGLEVMEHTEHDIEVQPDGSLRVWLAEKELSDLPGDTIWPWSH